MMNKIKSRLDALPDPECKWRAKGRTVTDIRDRPIAEVTAFEAQAVADFIVNAPEDIARLLAKVEYLQAEAAALRGALERSVSAFG